MKTRLISGSCYVAILVGFYCLKLFVHDFFFDALIYAFALIGTFEILRALKDKTTFVQRAIVFAFAAACIPVCALMEYYQGAGLFSMGVCFFVLGVALLSLLVLDYDETSLESIGLSLLSAIYPVVLLCLLVVTNHAAAPVGMEKFAFDSRLLILFIFVVSPCADSIAYVFGVSFKKYFPKKMAPKLSPNKTVIGGIGGLVGGMLGAAIVYFVYNGAVGSFDQMYLWLPVYLGMGLLASVATAFGDLVESCIKRKVNVKDMGKIMPGHGGALDRTDGTLFATMAVYLVYILVALAV